MILFKIRAGSSINSFSQYFHQFISNMVSVFTPRQGNLFLHRKRSTN